MRFSFNQSFMLGLLAATLSSGAVQALPPIVIQVQAEQASEAVAQSFIAFNPVQQSILDLSNAARQNKLLELLSFSTELNSAAQRHANDLARGAEFSHDGSDGSTMKSRIEDSGYQYSTIAENIYYQSPRNRPEKAVQGWLDSPSHSDNLLSEDFTEIGIGYATNGRDHYYVQVFGAP